MSCVRHGREIKHLRPTAVCPSSLSCGRLHTPSRAPLAKTTATPVPSQREHQSQRAVKPNRPSSRLVSSLLRSSGAGALRTPSPSQGGVEEDVGGRGLDGGGGHVGHLVVVKLVPALLGVVPAVGRVVAAVQPPVMVLLCGETEGELGKDPQSGKPRMFFCCCY